MSDTPILDDAPLELVRDGYVLTTDRARISVEDQGPGIPHTDRLRVWEPYVRLSRDVETATGGSGIGSSKC